MAITGLGLALAETLACFLLLDAFWPDAPSVDPCWFGCLHAAALLCAIAIFIPTTRLKAVWMVHRGDTQEKKTRQEQAGLAKYDPTSFIISSFDACLAAVIP